jgi:sugar (pentulose or hexulose) kinase
VGVDIGTSSIKAVGFDIDGNRLFEYRKPSSLIAFEDKPYWFEQDPHKILHNALELIRYVLSTCKDQEIAIGFSSTSPSLIPKIVRGSRSTTLSHGWTVEHTKKKLNQIGR